MRCGGDADVDDVLDGGSSGTDNIDVAGDPLTPDLTWPSGLGLRCHLCDVVTPVTVPEIL